MARRLLVAAAAANFLFWLGTAHADQILLLPESGANWLFHADAGSFGLISTTQASIPVTSAPAPTQDSTQANQSSVTATVASAPVYAPPVVDTPQWNPFLFVPANNSAIDNSPVVAPGPADLAELFLPDQSGANVPSIVPPAPVQDFSLWGDSPFLFHPAQPVINPVSNPVDGTFTAPPVFGPVDQTTPFSAAGNAPVATPEPGTFGLLIAGAAFALLRSSRSKRS